MCFIYTHSNTLIFRMLTLIKWRASVIAQVEISGETQDQIYRPLKVCNRDRGMFLGPDWWVSKETRSNKLLSLENKGPFTSYHVIKNS